MESVWKTGWPVKLVFKCSSKNAFHTQLHQSPTNLTLHLGYQKKMGFVSLKKYVTALLELLSFTITERNRVGKKKKKGKGKQKKKIKLEPGCHLQRDISTAHSYSTRHPNIRKYQQ